MREMPLTDRQTTDKSLYESYAPRVRGREVTAQSKHGSRTQRKGGAAMNSTATELTFTRRRRAMRGIVKVFIVGTLGLAVLFGSPGISLAMLKPPPFDPSSCKQISPDRWECLCGKKVCTCKSPDPKGCSPMSPLQGTPARQQAPVVKPIPPGEMQMQTK